MKRNFRRVPALAHRLRTVTVGAFVVVLSPAMLAACGSASHGATSTHGASNGTSTQTTSAASTTSADKVYAEFSGPVSQWPGPNQSVKVTPGKHLTVITCGSTGIGCVLVADGAKAAAAAIGDTATVIDGQQDPTVWNEAIHEAINSKSDGIILAAVPPVLVQGALKAAAAAHIPVAATLTTTGPGPVVRVNYNFTSVAKANAAFIAKNSGGNAHVLELTDYSDFPDLKHEEELYPNLLKSYCATCDVSASLSFTAADATQQLPGQVAQALQSNPSVNYIIVPFDTFNQFVLQGIQQAGRSKTVKIVGVGGDTTSVPLIKQGAEVESLGTPNEWMGWSAVDGLLRVMAGAKQAPLSAATNSNYDVPIRYVTVKNAPSVGAWQGEFDYEAKYRALWVK